VGLVAVPVVAVGLGGREDGPVVAGVGLGRGDGVRSVTFVGDGDAAGGVGTDGWDGLSGIGSRR
jgi:hypothetical protein